jgi:hypothetical protein
MATLFYPSPMPSTGQRQLSGPQALARKEKMTCLTATDRPTACQGRVHVGLFFDGTGNNAEWVQPDQPGGGAKTQRQLMKHSNVARLFDAHKDVLDRGVRRYYVQGVGTPFERLRDEGLSNTLGNLGGYKGADRINFGIIQVINAMHQYLASTPLMSESESAGLAMTLSTDYLKWVSLGMLSSENATRWAALTAVEQRLENIVKSHQRKLVSVNVSIYGFSRGAAQARACAHWLSQLIERRSDGSRTFAGVPIRVTFLGIFDTVAAVGLGDALPFSDGHMAWAKGTQSISPIVEKCVHFAALHEQRASFPVEAANRGLNIGYPGMHSDVGGGYRPNEQGKGAGDDGTNMLSQIPLIDMHFEAIKAGVTMDTVDEMKGRTPLSFKASPALINAYNAWLASHGVPAGDFRAVTEAHVRQAIRWRTQMHLSGHINYSERPFFARANNGWGDQAQIDASEREYNHQLRWLVERYNANRGVAGYLTERAKDVRAVLSRGVQVLPGARSLVTPSDFGLPPISDQEEHFVKVALEERDPSAASTALFDNYVHDSRAGFLSEYGREPIFLTGGYLRYRNVFESNAQQSRIYGWANAAWQGLKDAKDATIDMLNRLWEETVAAYENARARVRRAMATAAAGAASVAYEAAQRLVWEKYRNADRDLFELLKRRYR